MLASIAGLLGILFVPAFVTLAISPLFKNVVWAVLCSTLASPLILIFLDYLIKGYVSWEWYIGWPAAFLYAIAGSFPTGWIIEWRRSKKSGGEK